MIERSEAATTIRENLKDTLDVHLGGEYSINPEWILRAGLYSQQEMEIDNNGTQLFTTAGIGYTFDRSLVINLALKSNFLASASEGNVTRRVLAIHWMF